MELLFLALQNKINVRGEGLGIHGVDKNGFGRLVRMGYFRERPLAQDGPEAGLQKRFFYVPFGKAEDLTHGKLAENLRLLAAIGFQENILEETFVAAVDGDDPAANGRNDLYFRTMFIFKKRCADLDGIVDLHAKAGLGPSEIRRDNGNLPRQR